MSYLSDLKNGVLTPWGFLKKSAGWLARQSGLSDADVDALEAQADQALDVAEAAIEAAVGQALAQAFPIIPEKTRAVLAHQAARTAAESVNTAISAAGAFVKANN